MAPSVQSLSTETMAPVACDGETLGEVIAGRHMKQLRIAETEKYAHVTFFLNGGREDQFNGEDRILVPNNVVLSGAVVPLREPSGVDVRARLPSDVKPSQVEERIEDRVSVETRADPQVDLEEFDDGEVVVRVRATPVRREEGATLADQVVEALGEVHTAPRAG